MQKRSLLLFLVMLISITLMKVEAKKFTVDEVVSEFNDVVSKNYTLLEGLTASIDSENKKVKLTQNDQQILLDYTVDYIEYKYTGAVPTDDNTSVNFYITMVFHAFLDTVFNLSEISDYYSVENVENYDNDFDKYNVILIYNDYKYNEKNDAGEIVEKDGSYASEFKIGFDSDKITLFAENFAKSKYFDLVPNLIMKIDSGKVNYSFTLDYDKEDADDTPYCVVYRSDSLDGTYTKLANMSMACEGSAIGTTYLIDETAVTGNAYYYKAQVVGSAKFSNILKVDLTNNIITDTSNNEIIYSPSKDNDSSSEDKTPDNNEEDTKKDYQNPETGDFLPVLPILVLVLVSIGVWHKVKDKFIRI